MPSTDGPTVRDGRPEDAGVVETVARAAWHAAYDDVLGPGEVDRTVDEWYDREDLRTAIAGDGPFLVATESGAVVGFLGATVETDRVHVGRLYVHPDCWRGGHGRRLLGGLLDRLPADVTTVELEVLAENEVGRAFYRDLGFEVATRRESLVPRHDVEVLELVAPVDRVAARLAGDGR